MKALVIGGTSGLGLEIAKRLKQSHDSVIVTGRHNPNEDSLIFSNLDLSQYTNLSGSIEAIIQEHLPIEAVVYNPGFYQEGRISDLTNSEIEAMVNVGFLAAALLMKYVLQKQSRLSCFIAVTSTSQWTPREFEPVYTGVKAALGMFANSLSLDARIDKTLVVAPSGMKTSFWEGTNKDTSQMLDSNWVCEQIFGLLVGNFRYKYAKILRGPARVELVEVR